MSAIDSFTHVHVANFFNLPVYWIIEKGNLSNLTDNYKDQDTEVNQYFLSIGGGSGEHPALIFDIEAVIFQFLDNIEEISEPELMDNDAHKKDYAIYQLSEKIKNRILDADNNFENEDISKTQYTINQNQWDIESFVKINEKMKDKCVNFRLIEKIKNAVALFVIYDMPLEHCLKDKELLEISKMIRQGGWCHVLEIQEMFSGFTGVLNSQKFGKIIRDNKTCWGYSLTDWLKENT